MSKEYQTFEEWWKEFGYCYSLGVGDDEDSCSKAWHARDAELSAILGQFEAGINTIRRNNAASQFACNEFQALIQSVKKERGLL